MSTVLEPVELETLVNRLKLSRAECEARSRIVGSKCGCEWAKSTADYDDLRKLAAFEGEDLEELYLAIGSHDFYHAGEFAEYCFGDFACEAMDDSKMVEGFVEGASKVWDQVAAKV